MHSLDPLLSPRSIAVIGASAVPGKVGHEIVANLIASGFAGTILPINPKAGEILGLSAARDLGDHRDQIDLAVVAVPTSVVKDAIRAAIKHGVKAICIITAGFREVGEAGLKLENEVAGLCRDGGVRLLGPNCLGLINTAIKMNASFAAHMPQPGGIGVISQSGALCTAILDWADERGIGLSSVVSMGNKADVTEGDLIRAFSHDGQTKVIAGYLESIASGDTFMRIASEVSERLPIVLFKSGVTEAGGKAASSHTGSLAGADKAYGSAFRRAGVVRAETFEALFDYATAFANQPLPSGARVAVITNAGGPGIMAADAVELIGLKMATLDAEKMAALKERLPAAASVSNPIDVLGDADDNRYALALEAAMADPNVDAVVVLLTPQAMTRPVETAQAIADHACTTKPVLVSFMGGCDVQPGRQRLVACGIPDYPAPERAVAALKAMFDYAQWRRRPPRVLRRFPINRHRIKRIIRRHVRTERAQVGEGQAKEIFAACGIPIAPGGNASNAHEAVALATRIGYPVAMKIESPDIVHKSDLGGVKLNLSSPDAVRDAYDLMMLRLSQRAPTASIGTVYIERMCPRGREVILGMTRDPQFGPMLMFGLGGIFVEVMKDVTFNIAPITEQEAEQMLRSTRSYALLEGARGQGSVDIRSIAVTLQKISQLVTDFPEIEEMDINPFIVGRVGEGSTAADARIRLRL